ncbi:hypothetical protein YC2023_049674 [Brassica napus]
MICEKNCDFHSSGSELMIDNEQAIVELTVLQPEHPSSLVLSPQVFEEEPLDYPHQGPRLDSRKPLDEDLGPIFDEEDEPGPVFDEETTSITSIATESHLNFYPGTTHAPLSSELQEHFSVLSVQEKKVQPQKSESIDSSQQLEICRSIVVQTGYLGNASDRGSVQGEYLDIQKRFSSPSIREYLTSKRNSGPGKKQLKPKPILGFKMALSFSEIPKSGEMTMEL